MSRHRQSDDETEDKEKHARSKRDDTEELRTVVDESLSRIRSLDSEVDLLKQKVNAIIKDLLILKRAVIIEKNEIKGLQSTKEQGKT